MRYDDVALFIQKDGDGQEIISTYDKWNIVITAASVPNITAKELPNHSYPEENGEDVYIPEHQKVEAYDQEFMLAYKGNKGTMNGVIYGSGGLLEYLTNCKNGFSIYDKYRGIGRKNCYFKSLSDGNFILDSNDHFQCKLVVRVTNPLVNVVLNYVKPNGN